MAEETEEQVLEVRYGIPGNPRTKYLAVSGAASFLKPDENTKFSSRSSGSQWGRVRSADVAQRMHFARAGAGRSARTGPFLAWMDPKIVFQESYEDYLSDGLSPHDAVDRAYDDAQRLTETMMDELPGSRWAQQSAFSMTHIAREREKMKETFEQPIGSGARAGKSSGPRSVTIGRTSGNPNARAQGRHGGQEVGRGDNGAPPVTGPQEPLYMSWVSVDGNQYTLLKGVKVGSGVQPAPGFYNTLILHAFGEVVKGGALETVLGASGLSLDDSNGNLAIDFAAFLPGGNPASGSAEDDVPAGATLSA